MLQTETKTALAILTPGTVAAESMAIGRINKEPIFYALDGLLRYAKAYRAQYESTLSDDGVLGPYFLEALSGLRGLLNGDGAVAMELGRTTDSKDNGVCESIYWAARTAGGYAEDD